MRSVCEPLAVLSAGAASSAEAAGSAEREDGDASGEEASSVDGGHAEEAQQDTLGGGSLDAAQCALPGTSSLRRAAGAAPVALPNDAMSALPAVCSGGRSIVLGGHACVSGQLQSQPVALPCRASGGPPALAA